MCLGRRNKKRRKKATVGLTKYISENELPAYELIVKPLQHLQNEGDIINKKFDSKKHQKG